MQPLQSAEDLDAQIAQIMQCLGASPDHGGANIAGASTAIVDVVGPLDAQRMGDQVFAGTSNTGELPTLLKIQQALLEM